MVILAFKSHFNQGNAVNSARSCVAETISKLHHHKLRVPNCVQMENSRVKVH